MTLHFPAVRELIATSWEQHGKVTPKVAGLVLGEIADATINDDGGLHIAESMLRHVSQRLDELWGAPPINRELEAQLTRQYRALRAEIERYTTLRKLLA